MVVYGIVKEKKQLSDLRFMYLFVINNTTLCSCPCNHNFGFLKLDKRVLPSNNMNKLHFDGILLRISNSLKETYFGIVYLFLRALIGHDVVKKICLFKWRLLSSKSDIFYQFVLIR